MGEEQVVTEIVVESPDGASVTRRAGEHDGHDMRRALDRQSRSSRDEPAHVRIGVRVADLLGWWVAEDDKAVLIETSRPDAPACPLLVSVFPAPGAEPYRTPELPGGGTKRTERLVATPVTGDAASYLRIEAGLDGMGPTYHLYPVVRSADGRWRHPAGVTSPHEPPTALLPDVGTGLYDDWDDDLGVPWAFPLLPFAPRRDEHGS